ncbi:hypothetical protein BQ8482_330153 [Mesorhizobium delmotii]|uniref:Uncharacterized protein n=2 Tax=Mesorhizobium delmotii TaxID=1631247 RepID=A0A2P9APC5_9HYPH|nr:hypothetical protein BQ8482_330153 [Mesorhizobium delmotii]
MTKSPAKPRKTAVPAAPTWMNPASKREFSALVAFENKWKGHATATETKQLADLIDLRCRLDGLRKLVRSALRKKDAALTISLNREINSTLDRCQRCEAQLRLVDRENTSKEYSDR